MTQFWRAPYFNTALIPRGGGKGGGGSSIPANTSSTVTNQIQLPSWVDALAQQNVGTAQTLAQQPYTPFPGQTTAPLTPLQNAGINTVANTVGSTQPVYNAAISQEQNLPGATQSLMSPYLSNVENAAVSDIQRQGAISGENLASGAVGQGAFGGTRYGVEQGLLDSETQRNIGQTIAGIQSQGWNQAMTQAQGQAAEEGALATQGQTAALTGAGAAMTAGGVQQTQQQAQDAAALQQWQQQQNWPYQQLAIQQGALAGTPYGTTTSSTQPYAQNSTANLLGNIGAGLGLASAGSNLFSSGGLFGSNGALFGASGLFGSPGLFAANGAGLPGVAGPLGSGLLSGGLGLDAAGAAGAAGTADAAATAGAAGTAGKGGADAALALAA